MSGTFLTHIDLVEIPEDPLSPTPGFIRFYSKSDGKIYQKDSNGTISLVTQEGVPTFVQDSQPAHTGKYLWVQTNVGGDPDKFTLYFEDGNP